MNLIRDVWEGWTPQDFIDELEPWFDRMMTSSSLLEPRILSNEDLKKWCKENQPYYKKHIPEVYRYFKNRMKQFNYI
jgi:hypothetical protein